MGVGVGEGVLGGGGGVVGGETRGGVELERVFYAEEILGEKGVGNSGTRCLEGVLELAYAVAHLDYFGMELLGVGEDEPAALSGGECACGEGGETGRRGGGGGAHRRGRSRRTRAWSTTGRGRRDRTGRGGGVRRVFTGGRCAP